MRQSLLWLLQQSVSSFQSRQRAGEVQPWDLRHFPRSSVSALTLVKIRVCSRPPAACVDKDGVSFTVDVLERWAVFMVLHTDVTVATGAWAAFDISSTSILFLPFPMCILFMFLKRHPWTFHVHFISSHVRFRNTFQMYREKKGQVESPCLQSSPHISV